MIGKFERSCFAEQIPFQIPRKLDDLPDNKSLDWFGARAEGHKKLGEMSVLFEHQGRPLVATCSEVPEYEATDELGRTLIELPESESLLQFLAGAFRVIRPYRDYVALNRIMHLMIAGVGPEETLKRLTRVDQSPS